METHSDKASNKGCGVEAHIRVDAEMLARAREWLAEQEDAGRIAPCDELESLYALLSNLERACEGKQSIHNKVIAER